MPKEKLVQIHKDLSDLQMVFAQRGLIETIDADKLRAIPVVQEVIEEMLKYIKRTQG